MRFSHLTELVREIYSLLNFQGITLSVRHSRLKPPLIKWSLNGSVFQRLQGLVPDMCVDLFATSLNKQLPAYVSPFPDKGTV